MTGIYKITNRINGKAYIGQSYNIFERWYQHKHTTSKQSNSLLYKAFEKYGVENFDFSILEELDYIPELLNEREKYWIGFYHTFVDDTEGGGYNLTLGGEGMPTIEHQKVVEYWNEGKSLGEISAIMGHEPSTLRHHVTQCSNYSEEESRRRGNLWMWERRGEEVEQYTLKGEYITTFYNLMEAERQTGISQSNIWSAVSQKSFQAGGYQWKYTKDTRKLGDITKKTKIQNRPVVKIEKSGDIVEYPSAAEASRQTGISDIQIRKVCQGKGQTAGGYKWKYKES